MSISKRLLLDEQMHFTILSYISHTADTIPNSRSEETTSKCKLSYPFVIKDYMIRNAVVNKLDKKILLLDGEKNSVCMGIYDKCIKYI